MARGSWLALVLVACGAREAKLVEPVVIPTPAPAAPTASVAAAPPPPHRDAPALLMNAHAVPDACVYELPRDRDLLLYAAIDAKSAALSIASGVGVGHAQLTDGARAFAAIGGDAFDARGFVDLELYAAQEIAFGGFLFITVGARASPPTPTGGRLVAPTLIGLRPLAVLAPASVTCATFTAREPPLPPESQVLGTIDLGRTQRELFVTPGGPAVATVTGWEGVPVTEQTKTHFKIVWGDGDVQVRGFIKRAGISLHTDAYGLGGIGTIGHGSGSGDTRPQRRVTCVGPLTLLARVANGPRVPMLRVAPTSLVVIGDAADGFFEVTVSAPAGITAGSSKAALLARAEDIAGCAAP